MKRMIFFSLVTLSLANAAWAAVATETKWSPPLGRNAVNGCPSANDATGERPKPNFAQITVGAHKIAIEAELDDKDEIIFPPALLGRSAEPWVVKALQDENAEFHSHINKYRSQIGDLDRQLRLVAIDIKYGQEKQRLVEGHIASLQKELDNNGLATNEPSLAKDRLNLAERIVDYSLMRSDLDLQIAKSRDHSELIENRLAEIRRQHRAELLAELHATEARLQTLAESASAKIVPSAASARRKDCRRSHRQNVYRAGFASALRS